jgi:hypothetical protein
MGIRPKENTMYSIKRIICMIFVATALLAAGGCGGGGGSTTGSLSGSGK